MSPRFVLGSLALGLAALSMTPSLHAAPFGTPGRGAATRSVVYAQHGMVCAAQPLAVQAGLDILKQGGSAVDAAIAVNACLGLMEPTACGLGGDLFAMVWDPRGRRAARAERLGPRAAGAHGRQGAARARRHDPAALALLVDRARLRGRLVRTAREVRQAPLADDLAPAIRFARGGVPAVAGHRGRLGARRRACSRTSRASRRSSCRAAGRRDEGEMFRNPALARTLRAWSPRAARGVLRRARSPRSSCATRHANGGFFAAEDFARHTSTWDAPISTDYRGYTVWELPPPGQGLAALQMLNILENYDLKAMGRDSADYWHVFIEAKKLAFADRARYYADPAVREDAGGGAAVEGVREAQRAALIDMDHAAQRRLAAATPWRSPAARRPTCAPPTSSGMMVSLIQSNYTGFGSRLLRAGARLRPAGSRRAVLAAHGASELRWSRASGRSTRSSPRSSRGTASR